MYDEDKKIDLVNSIGSEKVEIAASAMMAVRFLVGFVGLIYGFVMMGRFFERMTTVEDGFIRLIGSGMRIFLLVLIIFSAVGLTEHVVWLVMLLTGRSNTDAGIRFKSIIRMTGTNIGAILQILAGLAAGAFGLFGITKGPGMLSEGSSVSGLYITCGVFLAVAIAFIVMGIIHIVKSFQNLV